MKSLPVFELHEENNKTNKTNILFRYPLKNNAKTKNKNKTKNKKWSKLFSL